MLFLDPFTNYLMFLAPPSSKALREHLANAEEGEMNQLTLGPSASSMYHLASSMYHSASSIYPPGIVIRPLQLYVPANPRPFANPPPRSTINHIPFQQVYLVDLNNGDNASIPPLQRTEKTELMYLISQHEYLLNKSYWKTITQMILAADHGHMSYFQIKILIEKLIGKTIRQLVTSYDLSCNNVAETILKRTTTGYLWIYSHKGG